MQSLLVRWRDYLLLLERHFHPSLHHDIESAFRARIFVVGAWTLAFFLYLAVGLRLLLSQEVTPLLWLVLVAGSIIGSSPLLIFKWGRLGWAGHLSTWCFLITMLGIAYMGIGLDAVVLLVAPLFVLAHAFFVSVRSAIWFALSVCIGVFGLLFLQEANALPQYYQPRGESARSMRAIVLALSSFLALILASAFEWSRKRSSQKLMESEERYSFATRSSHDGIFDWEVDSGEFRLTENFAALLGYEVDSLAMKKPFDEAYIAIDDLPLVVEIERRLHSGDTEFDVDLRFRRSDGGLGWFQVRGGAIHRGGKLVRVIGSIRDISERKQLEKMKDEFVSNVSHELRTPLASISGSLSLLQKLTTSTEQQREQLLELAGRNAERLLRLVNDLLDFQRLARGETELSKHMSAVQPFLVETVELHRSLASQCGVELRLKEAEASEALFVEIDTVRMHQVFGNLLSNAIKVSSQGHVVELSARVEEGQVVMAVKDEGPGIPSHMQERLFERFATDSSQNKQKIQGTGLGLAIARALVEAHGGTISFTTNRQQGTTFFVSLPRAM